jgi:predicted HicB family RNase H-like nuclease
LLGFDDVITFEGATPEKTAAAFRDSVDDYLAFCARIGQEPNKPFSGKFIVHVPADLQRRLSIVAAARGTSLNAIAVEGIESRLAELWDTMQLAKKDIKQKAAR